MDPISELLSSTAAVPTRRRLKPGERRRQILEALAAMLEQPGAERVTTAALAARIDVSEAALYRHFASKAQMFDALIEFIEQSVFERIDALVRRDAELDPAVRLRRIVTVLLHFGEKHPGLARVMAGDALVFENERLAARMDRFFDRIEAQLGRGPRAAGSAGSAADAERASLLTAFALGRLHRFARSGFRRRPTERLEAALRLICA